MKAIYHTSLVANANRLHHDNFEEYLLANCTALSVMRAWGYDMLTGSVKLAEVMIIPTHIVVEAKRYLPPATTEQDAIWAHPELMVLYEGQACELRSLPGSEAACLQSKPSSLPRGCYQHGLLQYSEHSWQRSHTVPELEVADHPLRCIDSEDCTPMHSVQLLCPEGFSPMLAGNLLLAVMAPQFQG
jgi:hypothetical protein